MTKLDGIMLSSFEDWAEKHWAEGLNCEFDDESERFTDDIVQSAWEAYREASRVLENSLVIGVEACKEGAAVCLIAKVKDYHYVMKSAYIHVQKNGIGSAIV